MKIAVLGAGVIGVTTAYYLARDGHEVTVVDRQDGAARETSFANAGEVSPGYSAPWAAPGIPMKAIQWLLQKHAPLAVKPSAINPEMIAWVTAMLRNCTGARYTLNKTRMVRLSEYSRNELIALRAAEGLDYDGRALGTLQVFASEKALHAASKDTAVLAQLGVPFELLDTAGCVAIEPGLAEVTQRFAGGLHLPGDETGDCHKFTVALAARCEAMGVAFRWGTRVKRLVQQSGRITAVETDGEPIVADRYVVAFASYSRAFLRPLGISVPVYPVKGYSITVPVTNEALAPRSTIMNERYKVAITRLGDRVRVGGMAELAGFDESLPEKRRETLIQAVTDLFPSVGPFGESNFWTGLRPMTPNGVPVIGGTEFPELFLNLGHGTLGWTMACGSARLIADAVAGRTSALGAAADIYRLDRRAASDA